MKLQRRDVGNPAGGGERETPVSGRAGGDTSALVFRVDGVAIPQGSMKGFIVNARVVMTSDNPKLKRWRQTVATAANVELMGRPAAERGRLVGAVALEALFVLPRPASLPRRVRDHVTRPDLDKLVRAVKDALTGVVWGDDSQVVQLTAGKVYTSVGETPHVDVRVEACEAAPLPLLEGAGC